MNKRILIFCFIIGFISNSACWAQQLPASSLSAIYSFDQSKGNWEVIDAFLADNTANLSAIDYYHLAYHTAINLKSDSLFTAFAQQGNTLKVNLRSPAANLVTIGLTLLEKNLTNQFFTKYELNSIMYDLANTTTFLEKEVESALYGSILLLIANDIATYKTFLNELTEKRLTNQLQQLTFEATPDLSILLKTRALLAVGKWKLSTLNDPYSAVELLTVGVKSLHDESDLHTTKSYFENLDLLAEALLQSNKLLTSFYTRQVILRELPAHKNYDKKLELKNYTRIAYLFKKQNNPDSMFYYANKASLVSGTGVNETHKIDAYFLLSNWFKDYKMNADSASYYLNLVSQIMLENDIRNDKDVIKLVTNQLQISNLEKKKKITDALAKNSFDLAKDLSLASDNEDKLTAICFFLELIITADVNGDFTKNSANATYLNAFLPYFESLVTGETPWSFNAFQILNIYGKAVRILNQNNLSSSKVETFLSHVEVALKAYFSIRNEQVIRENLLYLGHNVSELLSTSSDIYYELSKQIPIQEKKEAALEKSFVFADMNKAQLQVEQLLQANGFSASSIDKLKRSQYAENFSVAEEYRIALLSQPSYNLLEKIISTEKLHAELYAEIERNNPNWNNLWLDSEEYLSTIINAMDEQTSAVLYNIKNGKGRVFLLSSDGLQAEPIRYTENIEMLTQKLKESLIRAEEPSQEDYALYLSSILLSPFEKSIKKNVVIVPNEEVSMVPFAMLPIKNDPFLIDNHTLSLAPSLRVISMKKNEVVIPKKRIATFIPVTFDKYFQDETVSADRRYATNLPYSFLEGQGIAKIVKESNSIFDPFNYYRFQEFRGTDASRSNFISPWVTSSEIVHIATHAHTDVSNPENTKVLLNSDINEADATLMLRDIYYLTLDANLLVLNGCETGSGKILAGEGIVGITHAFLLTGVKNIIGTLWPVKDKAAAVFMEMFYQELFSMDKEEVDYSVALQKTMLKMKAIPEFSNPINWSNFYCITSYGNLNSPTN